MKTIKNVAFDSFLDARTANRCEICLLNSFYFLFKINAKVSFSKSKPF